MHRKNQHTISKRNPLQVSPLLFSSTPHVPRKQFTSQGTRGPQGAHGNTVLRLFPDDSKLGYLRRRGENFHIHRLDGDGARLRRLARFLHRLSTCWLYKMHTCASSYECCLGRRLDRVQAGRDWCCRMHPRATFSQRNVVTARQIWLAARHSFKASANRPDTAL